jgi:LPPG:FO 2-phospho-L-lactate transferase
MTRQVTVLTGGVGGAKLVLGLSQLLPPGTVTAIVNTGDDFDHLGLRISPDLDTLLYTLSDKANSEQGWGRKAETWSFMSALRSLGAEDWFMLGDGDLALHVLRSEQLRQGLPLSSICARFAAAWGVKTRLLPMSDDPVATQVATDEGQLAFQDYFVRRRCEPRVTGVSFGGAANAIPAPGVLEAITDPTVEAILIAPSNPYLSIDPILAIPAIRSALIAARAPVVAVSPIINGQSVKGPTGKMMAEFGLGVGVLGVVEHYSDYLDGIVVDASDTAKALPIPSASTDIMMCSIDDKIRVAAKVLDLAAALKR